MSEYPPTPECVDVCPATPDSVVELKSPSEEERGANNSSPPPNCAICLGNCKNKCFTDSCLHQFCFNCLVEWSKIKAECPLCKQAFRSIIHNVKSEFQFEEYMVQSVRSPPCEYFNLIVSEPSRYQYSATLQVGPRQTEALRLLFQHNSVNAPFIPPYRRHPTMRHRIYERGLYALPLLDITGRARDCSAEFYRNNQAQVHRLMPFLNREAVSLIQDERQVSSLMSRAPDILTRCDIMSTEFRQFVEPYFRQNTSQFLHEFYNFARSPFDMYGYDNNVEYSANYNLALNTVSGTTSNNIPSSTTSSSSGASSSSGTTAGPTTNTTTTSSSRRNNIDVVRILSTSSSSESESEDASGSSTSTNNRKVRRPLPAAAEENTSVIVSIPGGDAASSTSISVATVESEASTSAGRLETVIKSAPAVNIDLSDTDSDECQFVQAIKPPHLRTPEYVSLNSDDEDSDVVFVNELPAMVGSEPVTATIDAPACEHQISNVRFPIRPLASTARIGFTTKNALQDQGWSSDENNEEEQGMTSAEKGEMMSQFKLEKLENPMLGSTSSGFHVYNAATSTTTRRSKRLHQERKTGKARRTIYEDSSAESSEEEEDDDDVCSSSSGDEYVDHSYTTTSARLRATARQHNNNRVTKTVYFSSSESSSESEHEEYSIAASTSSSKRKCKRPAYMEKRESLTMTLMKKPQNKKKRRKPNKSSKKGHKKKSPLVTTPAKERKAKRSKRDKNEKKEERLSTPDILLDMPGPSSMPQLFSSWLEINDLLDAEFGTPAATSTEEMTEANEGAANLVANQQQEDATLDPESANGQPIGDILNGQLDFGLDDDINNS